MLVQSSGILFFCSSRRVADDCSAHSLEPRVSSQSDSNKNEGEQLNGRRETRESKREKEKACIKRCSYPCTRGVQSERAVGRRVTGVLTL